MAVDMQLGDLESGEFANLDPAAEQYESGELL